MTLCFATNNLHKLEEVQAILGPPFLLKSLNDIGCVEELAEDQTTLEGNSLQKAEYVFKHYHAPCFADDTGLEVEALNGAPGVYSARYAGLQRSAEDNMNLLLKDLANKKNRKARFRTVITLVAPNFVKQFEGVVAGEIIFEKRGKGGFGYDPIFIPAGHSKTLAEMTMEEKNQISHRANAIKELVTFLKNNQGFQ